LSPANSGEIPGIYIYNVCRIALVIPIHLNGEEINRAGYILIPIFVIKPAPRRGTSKFV